MARGVQFMAICVISWPASCRRARNFWTFVRFIVPSSSIGVRTTMAVFTLYVNEGGWPPPGSSTERLCRVVLLGGRFGLF